MLKLHYLTDFKAQLNINKVHDHKSVNIARSYQRTRRDDIKTMANR